MGPDRAERKLQELLGWVKFAVSFNLFSSNLVMQRHGKIMLPLDNPYVMSGKLTVFREKKLYASVLLSSNTED